MPPKYLSLNCTGPGLFWPCHIWLCNGLEPSHEAGLSMGFHLSPCRGEWAARVSNVSSAGPHRPVQGLMSPNPTAEPRMNSFLPQTSKENTASQFAEGRRYRDVHVLCRETIVYTNLQSSGKNCFGFLWEKKVWGYGNSIRDNVSQ